MVNGAREIGFAKNKNKKAQFGFQEGEGAGRGGPAGPSELPLGGGSANPGAAQQRDKLPRAAAKNARTGSGSVSPDL